MARLNLPRPSRVVRQGVRVAGRLGYDRREALLLIARVAAAAGEQVQLLGEYDTGWIADIGREAECQLAAIRHRHQ